MYIEYRFPKITNLVKRILHFLVIVSIFSALPLLYAQETLETTLQVAEVSYDVAVPEADIVPESGISLNSTNPTEVHKGACSSFEYVIFAILAIIIGIMVSYRIRNNTLKLF